MPCPCGNRATPVYECRECYKRLCYECAVTCAAGCGGSAYCAECVVLNAPGCDRPPLTLFAGRYFCDNDLPEAELSLPTYPIYAEPLETIA